MTIKLLDYLLIILIILYTVTIPLLMYINLEAFKTGVIVCKIY